MNIQGITILTEKIIYGPQWFGIVAWIISVIAGFFFLMLVIEGDEMWAIIPTVTCFILFITFIAIAFEENHNTFLNKPSKIQYTIEIIDDNAWKEIGPNYNVIEQPYEKKKIYVIEGDYINDNT